MSTTRIAWTLSLLFGAFFAGCGVPEETHQETRDLLADFERRLGECLQATESLQSDEARLRSELHQTDVRLASCSSSLTAQQSQVEAMRLENEQRRAVHDEMIARLAAMVDAGQLEIDVEEDRLVLRMQPTSAYGQQALSELASLLAHSEREGE